MYTKCFIFAKTSSKVPELIANSSSVWNDYNILSEVVIYEEDVYSAFYIVDMLQNVSRSDLKLITRLLLDKGHTQSFTS